MKIEKIIVFTGALTHSVLKGIVEIDKSISGLSWLVILSSPKKRPAQLLRSQWRNFRKNGWRWIPYQLNDIRERLLKQKISFNKISAIGEEFTIDYLRSLSNVEILVVEDIHATTTFEAVSAFAPDIGLSLAAPILRRQLFSIPTLGTLNLHKGKVPNYRGMPPAFWELWNDADTIGCTVHWVDDKLDTGAVVQEATMSRDKYSTVRGLQLCLDEVGIDLMRNAIQGLIDDNWKETPQALGGKTYQKPTLKQISTLTRKISELHPQKISTTKRILKTPISHVGFKAWEIALSRIVSPRITVLLYHRVTDDVRDNLTVGIEQFDRQMALLKKHCCVLSIDEVVATKKVIRGDAPLVCVTFDDGYLDNYKNAVQILLRHQIPAGFFVSTGIVGTENTFPHDVRRGNSPIPVMQWNHLKKMKDYGFSIGSHSVNHINCASEPTHIVEGELSQSLMHLQNNLGLRDVLFAYPYGGRNHMTAERLELVKQTGYAGCLSAYGGANIGTVDPFNVLRRGIHWEFSDDAFLFASLGLR